MVTPKLNETRVVNPEGNNSQNNPNTETHNETVEEESFETPMSGSTRESIITNTNSKSRSTKILASKIATQQKRNSLMETTERSEGEEFSNRSTASTSQSVTERRYRLRSASRQRKILITTYLFLKMIQLNAEGVELTLERAAELETSPIV